MSFPFKRRGELPEGVEPGDDNRFVLFFIGLVVAVLSSMGLLVDHAIKEACGADQAVTINRAYDPEQYIRPPPDFKEASLKGFSETVIPAWGYINFRVTDVLTI